MSEADKTSGAPVASVPERDRVHELFGDRADLAERFAARLARDAVEQGLIGPREVPHLWDRHLYNCAGLTELIASGSRVVDVGSGAGLPGLVVAIRRPDLRVDLVEPLLRRSEFLRAAVIELDLADQVRVLRGRAEDQSVLREVGSAAYVTARAVAPLDRLVRWCVPLLDPGGTLLALKGRRVQDEVAKAAHAIAAVGGTLTDVVEVGSGPSTTNVVRIVRTGRPRSKRRGSR